MFDNLIGQEEKQSPIDVLLKLLDEDSKDRKTNLEMPHIKTVIINYRLFLRRTTDLSSIEIDYKVLQLYKDLRVSYKGGSWEKIVEGIKEMKPQLLDANIQEGMMKK